jgi:hypothetical protein
MKRILQYQFIAIALSAIIYPSCAPVFSELQSARTVGKDSIEVTPSLSNVGFKEGDNSMDVQRHMGVQIAYGLSSRTDIRFRLERIWFPSYPEQKGFTVIGVGPKFNLAKEKVAFAIPIGRALGEGTENSWEIHPTLIFTIPAVKNKFDINISPKYLMILGPEYEGLVAVNLGCALSTNLKKWAIRPEYGMLFKPGESGHYSQFSIGLSFAFGK